MKKLAHICGQTSHMFVVEHLNGVNHVTWDQTQMVLAVERANVILIKRMVDGFAAGLLQQEALAVKGLTLMVNAREILSPVSREELSERSVEEFRFS
ncbi:MAG: hypothetical protein VX617_05725 [Pseudomonadota bacterium]|nr:hypothetical protein [Pseudomonadota bacterium]